MRTNYQNQKPHFLFQTQFKEGFTLFVFTLFAVFTLSPLAAEGTVHKSATEQFTNNDSRDIWKIYYKFSTPESKQDECWMESTDTWLENEHCCRQSSCEYDENDDGEAWRG